MSRALLLAAALALPSTLPSAGAAAPTAPTASRALLRDLVQESYRTTGARGLTDFDTWLARAFASRPDLRFDAASPGTLDAALAARRRALDGLSGERLSAAERATAAWLHRATKAMIPKFSLERGFEFANVVKLGERQCLLQSVLLRALLGEAGVRADVAMVWKNERGVESNLGHVVAVVRLPEGRDLLLDASDATPFMRHRGLLLRVGKGANAPERFVAPVFAPDDAITAYREVGNGATVPPTDAQGLDAAYVRSQFDYYRGERAPHGFVGPSTPAGLAASARFLERAVREQPRNPLATLVLGHVYRKQGHAAQAAGQYRRAGELYRAAGYVPAGVRDALRWADTGGRG